MKKLSNIAILGLGQAATHGLTIIFTLLITIFYDPGTYAEFAKITAIAIILSYIQTFRLEFLYNNSDSDKATKILAQYFFRSSLFIFLTALFFTILFNDYKYILIFFYSTGLGIFSIYTQLLLSQQNHKRLSIIRPMRILIQGIVVISFAPKLLTLIIASIVGTSLSFKTTIKQLLKGISKKKLSKKLFSNHLRLQLPLVFSVILNAYTGNIIILNSSFLTVSSLSLGLFVMALKLHTMLNILISAPFSDHFYQSALKDRNKLSLFVIHEFNRLGVLALASFSLCSILLFLCVDFLNEAWRDVDIYFYLMLPWFLSASISSPLSSLFVLHNQNLKPLLIELIFFTIKMIVLFFCGTVYMNLEFAEIIRIFVILSVLQNFVSLYFSIRLFVPDIMYKIIYRFLFLIFIIFTIGEIFLIHA